MILTGDSLLTLLALCLVFPVGFNVGRSAGGRSTVREINRDACHFPGFPVLQSLLPKHTNVPALYFLLMALFLQQPVTELPENLQVSAPVISSQCNQGAKVGIVQQDVNAILSVMKENNGLTRPSPSSLQLTHSHDVVFSAELCGVGICRSQLAMA